MIRAFSTLLSIALAVDGGTPDERIGIMIESPITKQICVATPDSDRYYSNADAGVYEVPGMITKDGQRLGRGWFLTPDRMQRVGAAIDKPQEPPSTGFVLGVVVGVITTVIAVFAIQHKKDESK